MENINFAFVANPLTIDCELPFEIIEGWYLQKANDMQIDDIRSILYSMGDNHLGFKHECEAVLEQNNSYRRMPREKWNYYVISFLENNKETFMRLQLAANLAEIDLELGLSWLSELQKYEISFTVNFMTYLGNWKLNPDLEKNKHLEIENLLELKSIFDKIKHFDATKYPHIAKCIDNFYHLNRLPIDSDFVIIGFFGIIESLITYNPGDKGASLKHQIRKKIPLLVKRFSCKVEYEIFFNPCSEDKLWSTLYDYRSCIAHGNESDFKKQLSLLKSRKTVLIFLKSFLKKLINHSMTEPQLYIDLKEC
ncbi:hypothetical protein [Anabaena lutea]|uniref:Apea-like HEPN domain-containing protein n=1 Tax=Anabaena lutea FACHB-196 TaxID=2692881 RepID=A0ABR8FPQ6_9NOST|nr:hypothetical protein [Anabaena lutea]MBD2570924.1 hypothetical protein [Anabaena lutea FACHB-196]